MFNNMDWCDEANLWFWELLRVIREDTVLSSVLKRSVLEKMVELSSQIEGIDKKEFYEKLTNKFRDRRLMASQQDRASFLDELLQMYVDEWRKE